MEVGFEVGLGLGEGGGREVLGLGVGVGVGREGLELGLGLVGRGWYWGCVVKEGVGYQLVLGLCSERRGCYYKGLKL